MLIPTLILGTIALILVLIGIFQGNGQHVTGLKAAWVMTIQVLPLLIFAFIVAGMVQVLIPREIIAKWVGGESGFKGIIIGSIAGGLSPGGPYVSLPIVAGLIKSGAGVGTMVAFLTGWSIWAVGRIPMEIGILGWKFTLIRIVSTFVFPPIAGYIANFFFANAKL